MLLLLIIFVLSTFLTPGPTQAQVKGPEVKKLIYFGSGMPDTQYIRDHWREMEKMPFDGVGLVVAIDRRAWQQGKRDSGNQLRWQVMGRKAFQIGEFREAIVDLQSARWHSMTDNFLPVSLSASQSAAGLLWFDDGRWHTITNNFAVLARIGAEGHIKGLILDPEHYNYELFNYAEQRKHVDRPFQEYLHKARQRGREVITAVAAVLPDSVLFSLYGYSLPLRYLRDGKGLQEVHYSLLPAFYDGLLEAMPAGMQLVDGYEFAYPFKERQQFLNGYHQIHQEALKLSAVPDRYQEKLKAGFGLWLDYKRQPDYFTPEEFRQAVIRALEVSDKYVWIYSQGPRFFPVAQVQKAYIDAIATARREVRQ
jgi:hypothetical protein